MTIAITRKVSPAFADCELTHLSRQPIDVARAARQHEAYERALEELSCRLIRLPEEPTLPDSVFVEDVAVIVPEVAVLTRPGAVSRRPEVESVARVLADHRPLARIEAPGILDGGDVLRIGKRLFVGLTTRSDPGGIAQLRAHLAPHGYTVEGVAVTGCLHLKTAVTAVLEDTLLLNPAWVDAAPFAGYPRIEVDPEEPFGGNAVWVSGAAIYPSTFPRTAERLERAGVRLVLVDLSELAKAEGAVTCCSLLLT